MNSNGIFIGEKVWANLVKASVELGYIPSREDIEYPQYKRLVVNTRYHLLTFEVERSKFPGFPNDRPVGMEAQEILSSYFNNIRLDIVDLGKTLYFNFWISHIDQGYKLESELVYV